MKFIFIMLICGYFDNVQNLPIGIPPNSKVTRLNSTLMRPFSWGSFPNDTVSPLCRLYPVDKGIHGEVNNALEFSKLIEYTFDVAGYNVNPLAVNNTYNYKTQHWARTVSSHGQTILNLAFNYGILSLMTLSFGVTKMHVQLEEEPYGCLTMLNEDQKVWAVMDIVLRDLKSDGRIKVFEGQSSVCHQYIKQMGDKAKFTDRCCYEANDSEAIDCITDIPNKWLDVLHILLGGLTICVFIFGPMMIPDWFYIAASDTLEYYVKLKEPLYKKIAISRKDKAQDIDADHVVDLRNHKDFKICRRLIAELPEDKVIPIKISQFDIKVNYTKLLPENNVPVGLIESLSRAVFLCKIREIGAFKDCCDASIMGCVCAEKEDNPPTWISICNLIGRILLVFFVPIPFYIRLVVYYIFENPEIMDRHEAADNLGLDVWFNSRLLQFLTPTHPLYIMVYIIYFLAAFTVAYYSGRERKTRFQQVIMDAFQDMKDLNMLNAVGMFINNCLWPFKKYGVFGVIIGILSWPFILPVSIMLCLIYCLPLIFVSFRIILYTFSDDDDVEDAEERRDRYRPDPQEFQADQVLGKLNSESRKKALQDFGYCNPNILRFTLNVFLSTMAIMTLFSSMLIVSEVATFLAEILSFTMMGIIVNASTVLKYVTLLFLVILYSYDCYSNVNKKYLKLNKAIFSEIKWRLGKDIEQYTQLPVEIQENRGFKAVEASGQAEYESIDDFSFTHLFHWDINDLILFVDKEDMPRIPKQLFEEVCEIKVAGAPGPVYYSLIIATRKFMIIILFLLFVFIVVSSFSDNGKSSSKNHTLIAMAGGFAPLMFRYVFKPGNVDVETNLLSFKSKLEEIIKNFCQRWPMYDFVFDIEEEPKSEDDQKDSKSEKSDDENESETAKCCCCCDYHGKHDYKDCDIVTDKMREKLCLDFGPNVQENNLEKNMTNCKCGKVEKGKIDKDNNKDSKDKKGKNGKDKNDKDKKDKNGKDKKDNKDWLKEISKTKNFDMFEIKEKLDKMVFESAEGEKVDILIYVSDSDKEWDYELSLHDFSMEETDRRSNDSLIKTENMTPTTDHIALNILQNV